MQVSLDATATRLPNLAPRFVTNWLWPCAAVIPFLSVYGLHYTCRNGAPTGFLGYDQPYYVANGRAIFERGNGLAYPNPFDPSDDAPVIYFHWLVWVLGVCVVKGGFDPGALLVGMHVIAAVACGRVTLALVDRCLPDHRFRNVLFLLSMWGGGVLALCAWCANQFWGKGLSWSGLLRFDPGDGWWFLNWGRNCVYPMESVYHVLMAATWLSILDRRWRLALISSALLAATHPFTGLQVLVILVAWGLARCLAHPPEMAWWELVAALALLIGLLGYNLVYLAGFEPHRELEARWTIPWTLDWPAMLMAYLPIGCVAFVRIVRDSHALDRRVHFWIVAFLSSFLLANHEWFVTARQPLHFTRGYIWMPLFLIALPLIQQGLVWLNRDRRRWLSLGAPALVLGALAVCDNAAFLGQYAERRAEYGFFLAPAERDMFRQMNGQRVRGVMLCKDERLSYLSATYTSVRPYAGHMVNTPSYDARRAQITAWFDRGESGPWFATITLILARRDEIPRHVSDDRWQVILANEEWRLLERTAL